MPLPEIYKRRRVSNNAASVSRSDIDSPIISLPVLLYLHLYTRQYSSSSRTHTRNDCLAVSPTQNSVQVFCSMKKKLSESRMHCSYSTSSVWQVGELDIFLWWLGCRSSSHNGCCCENGPDFELHLLSGVKVC
jgi:hypothetical protein